MKLDSRSFIASQMRCHHQQHPTAPHPPPANQMRLHCQPRPTASTYKLNITFSTNTTFQLCTLTSQHHHPLAPPSMYIHVQWILVTTFPHTSMEAYIYKLIQGERIIRKGGSCITCEYAHILNWSGGKLPQEIFAF